MKNSRFLPQFLGIGAPKAGTSWLWANLDKHPDVWMPPIKEIHYFDRSPDYPSLSALFSDRFLDRVFGSGEHNKRYRRLLRRIIRAHVRHPDGRRIRWDARYLLGRYDDDWYASLFRDAGDKISGEITPSYSLLNSEDVGHIQRLMPRLKVIYLLRNPIDRACSHIGHGWRKAALEQTSSFPKLKTFVDDPNQTLRSDYLRTINLWRSYFPEKQIFLGFYDDITLNPKSLLIQIFHFLGVEATESVITNGAFERVNAFPKKKVPRELEVYLASKYHGEIKQLSQLLGGHSMTWLKNAEKILQTSE